MPLDLSTQRLLIVSGKGGVGKSTVAAALALVSKRRGERTLMCELNANERVTALLGYPPAGAELTRLDEHLFAVNIRPADAMREYALMTLRFKAIYSAVFENRMMRYFLRFIPSLQELVTLGKVLFHVQEKGDDGRPRFDRVIVDAPATGHALTFLRVPQVLLDTVPKGQLWNEAEKMRDLLVDPATTAAILVALPEELPVNETLDLEAALTQTVRVSVGAIVLNAFVEPRFSEQDLASLASTASLSKVAREHSDRARLSADARSRLSGRVGAERVLVLPRLFTTSFDRTAVEALARGLRPLFGDTVGTGGAP